MLDRLLTRVMVESDALRGILAKFDGEPAVFYGQAPADNKRGWGSVHYPMLVYSSDERYNPERKTAGTMTADILCTDNCAAGPEDIAPVLVDLLSGLFLTGEGETACILWNRTNSFQQRASYENEPVVTGETVSFDVLSFPAQETADPDPILALNRWTRAELPQAALIGYDGMPEIFMPADAAPAVYWRTSNLSTPVRQTFAVSWMEAQLVAHVFAPTPAIRQRFLRKIINGLALDGQIAMPDGSPLTVNRLACNMQADPMQQGQLTVTATFGVLRPHTAGVPLNHAKINRGLTKEG